MSKQVGISKAVRISHRPSTQRNESRLERVAESLDGVLDQVTESIVDIGSGMFDCFVETAQSIGQHFQQDFKFSFEELQQETFPEAFTEAFQQSSPARFRIFLDNFQQVTDFRPAGPETYRTLAYNLSNITEQLVRSAAKVENEWLIEDAKQLLKVVQETQDEASRFVEGATILDIECGFELVSSLALQVHKEVHEA